MGTGISRNRQICARLLLGLRDRQLLSLVEELRVGLVTQILDLESALIPIKAQILQLLLSHGTVGFLSSHPPPSPGETGLLYWECVGIFCIIQSEEHFRDSVQDQNSLEVREPSGHWNGAHLCMSGSEF